MDHEVEEGRNLLLNGHASTMQRRSKFIEDESKDDGDEGSEAEEVSQEEAEAEEAEAKDKFVVSTDHVDPPVTIEGHNESSFIWNAVFDETSLKPLKRLRDELENKLQLGFYQAGQRKDKEDGVIASYVQMAYPDKDKPDKLIYFVFDYKPVVITKDKDKSKLNFMKMTIKVLKEEGKKTKDYCFLFNNTKQRDVHTPHAKGPQKVLFDFGEEGERRAPNLKENFDCFLDYKEFEKDDQNEKKIIAFMITMYREGNNIPNIAWDTVTEARRIEKLTRDTVTEAKKIEKLTKKKRKLEETIIVQD